jgi:anaerobic magnesium-protoporphyrin IX monomethyl ester cyclase
MTAQRRILLVNPQMTSRRHARFPLSLLTLAGALEKTSTCHVVDGNVDGGYLSHIERSVAAEHYDAVGLTVMGGPQVQSAIDCSKVVRRVSPTTPVVWGGYFPTLYTNAAMNAPYVDYAIRGAGELALAELLEAIPTGDIDRLGRIAGLTWKRDGAVVHNADRRSRDERPSTPLPYDLLGDPRMYLARTFLGNRTAVHQAALGCRFRCTFCGVAAMFRGATHLPPAERLERDLTWLKDSLGADSLQFFDHNFFDREEAMIPLLEVLARIQLPWWCYARADALIGLSEATWKLVRKSRLKMAYIGAESPNDAMLASIRKGTHSNQTLEVAELCRRNGVVPELSFMVGPPDDTEAETERTFEFIRQVKKVNPDSEIIIYIYTPLPPDSLPKNARVRAGARQLQDLNGNLIQYPATPEEWTEKRWVDYSCHADAPWLTERVRQRIQNFTTVLGCRFPTAQDVRNPAWSKTALKAMASWRYRFRRYDRPWELALSKRLVRLANPQVTSL